MNEQQIDKRKLIELIKLRLKHLREAKHLLKQDIIHNKKKTNSPTFKQMKGRMMELQRLARHLLYDNFDVSFPKYKDTQDCKSSNHDKEF